VGTTNFPAN